MVIAFMAMRKHTELQTEADHFLRGKK